MQGCPTNLGNTRPVVLVASFGRGHIFCFSTVICFSVILLFPYAFLYSTILSVLYLLSLGGSSEWSQQSTFVKPHNNIHVHANQFFSFYLPEDLQGWLLLLIGPFQLAKMGRYLKNEKFTDFFFVGFLVIWIISRLGFFPFV